MFFDGKCDWEGRLGRRFTSETKQSNDPKADINESIKRGQGEAGSDKTSGRVERTNLPCQETFLQCKRKTKPSKSTCSDEQCCCGK